MNAKQKLHQANLESWVLRIQTQSESGLTIKAWREQNNVSFNAYNYWKHLLKEEYVNSCIPDIVPISVDSESSQLPSCDSSDSREVCSSRSSRHSYEPQPIRICTADADVSISPTASDDLLLRILKAVCYA